VQNYNSGGSGGSGGNAYIKMAEEGTELPILLNEGEEDNVAKPIEPVVKKEVRVPREFHEDRYRLKAPTFSGEEPVEQFVQEFQDVMEVAQWPPRVALLKLRMALSDKAKPYGVGPSIDGIFASLRTRFGISAVDARARLQRLRRDPHTPLQEHATTVMRLAQIAFRNLPQANRERYTYDAFVQSINDLGLHHQCLARGVPSQRCACRKGSLLSGEAPESCDFPSGGHGALRCSCRSKCGNSSGSQCDADDGSIEGRTNDRHVSQTGLHIGPLSQLDTAREPGGPQVQSSGRGHPFCWECGRQGHFQKHCPQLHPGLNYDGPQMLPHLADR